VTDIFNLQILKIYHIFVNRKLPDYFLQFPFDPMVNNHNYSTRTQHNLKTDKINHEFAKYCLRQNLPRLVNNTPHFIKIKVNTHSLKGFATYIKKYYIDNYQALCAVPNCYICQHM
jgi:hypothetical protein